MWLIQTGVPAVGVVTGVIEDQSIALKPFLSSLKAGRLDFRSAWVPAGTFRVAYQYTDPSGTTLEGRGPRQPYFLASNGSVDNRSLSARKGSLAACSDYASVKAVFIAMSDPAGRRWSFLRLYTESQQHLPDPIFSIDSAEFRPVSYHARIRLPWAGGK